MKSYSEFIEAGKPLQLSIGGRLLYVQRSAAGPVLDVTFVRQNAEAQTVERVGKGFRASPVGGFSGIKIKAAVSGVVDFVVTDGDIAIQFDEDTTTVGNDDGQAIPIRAKVGERLPVDIGGGTISVTADNVKINNTEEFPVPVHQKTGEVFLVQENKQAEIVDFNPAAVGLARVLLVDDDTLQRVRFRNGNAAAKVAIGGAAVTLENAVILLEPGDVWAEDAAPGAAWYAISDTAGVSVQVQGLK